MEAESKDILEQKHYFIYRDKRLGSGSFGKVYRGLDRQRRRRVAVKEVDNASVEYAQREVDILMTLKEHDNVVRIYDSFIYGTSLWIVMQFCKGPTLNTYMEKDHPELQVKLSIMEQCGDALSYMCTSPTPTAHRDLKPDNIIIVNGFHVKICDYGLSRAIDPNNSIHVATLAGSRYYMAPELFEEFLKYDPFKVDIFSLGLIILAMLTFVPGEGMEHFFQPGFGGWQMILDRSDRALQQKLASFKSPCPWTTRLISLVRRMVSYTPTKRPDIHEVLDEILDVQESIEEPDGGAKGGADVRSEDTGQESTDEQGGGAHGGTDARSGDIGKVVSGGKDGTRPKTSDPGTERRVTGVHSGLVPSLQLISQHELGFEAHWRAGFSFNNHILISDQASHPHLHLYKHEDTAYSRVWEKPLPSDMDSDCCKALLGSADILLQNAYDCVTVHYDSHMQERRTLQRSGFLRDCLPDDHVVFCRGTWKIGDNVEFDKDWLINVYGEEEEEQPVTLQPPGDWGWEAGLSVCSVRDCITVVENKSRSFDVFTKQGEHLLHRELSFRPSCPYGVSACDGRIFVSEYCTPAVIHVLTMDGEEVGVIRHEALGLTEDDWVWGICCCPGEGLLHLCVGHRRPHEEWNITSLRAYRVGGTQ